MPKVVGETAAGEPIYEVQSVRVMLRAGAAHFSRIVACAKCGSDVPGPSVLNPADLEHPANPILCLQCVKLASPAVAPDTAAPAAVEHRLEQLHATFSAEAIRAGAAVDRVVQGTFELREAQVEIDRRLDELTDRLAQVEGTIDQLAAALEGGKSSVANAELARIEEQLNQRIDGLAEKAARADDTEAERRRALEKQVRAGLRRTAKALESHRRELQVELREQLAEVQAAVPPTASVGDNRLEVLEERVQRGDGAMSELGELHAALDVGLGALRSEIAEVRNAVKKVAGEQADVQDRLEDLDRSPRTAAPADSGRGRKQSRKADAGANLAVAIEAAEILAREHQQLKAQVADLEKAAEAAAATAARASALATASGPLRSDVRLLQEQLAAQNEAIGALGRTVERLRRKVSTPAAAQPPSKPATKPAAKPARKTATKSAKRA